MPTARSQIITIYVAEGSGRGFRLFRGRKPETAEDIEACPSDAAVAMKRAGPGRSGSRCQEAFSSASGRAQHSADGEVEVSPVRLPII